jgi:hypothetical protein
MSLNIYGRGDIEMDKDEEIIYVRSDLEDSKNKLAIITNLGLHIFQISTDNFIILQKQLSVAWTDLIQTPSKRVYSIKDLLVFHNLLIVDADIGGGRRRIYIYDLDLERKLFYTYGFITIQSELASKGDYHMYYSKEHDKAILVYLSSKTVVEYSLDNVFLDLNRIGRELIEDTRTVFSNYGKFKILEMIPNWSQESNNYEAVTLSVAHNNYYLLLFKAIDENEDSGAEKIEPIMLVLRAEIDEYPLGVFRSHTFPYDPQARFLLPSIVSEIKSSNFLPLFRFSRRQGMNIMFFWEEDFLELNYNTIVNHGDSLDKPILLNLDFDDPSGNHYEEYFEVVRDARFQILPKQNGKSFEKVKQSMRTYQLSLPSMGLVSSIGLSCISVQKFYQSASEDYKILTNVDSKINRNRSIHLGCEKFDVTYVSPFNRMAMLDVRGSVWKDPRDMLRLDNENSHEARLYLNHFGVLQNNSIILFKADHKSLQIIAVFSDIQGASKISGRPDISLQECISIKHLRIANLAPMQDIEISLFCIGSQGTLLEVMLSMSLADYKEAMISKEPLQVVYPVSGYYPVPEKIWRSFNQDKNNVRFADELIFVKTEVTLLSVGAKTIIEVYLCVEGVREGQQGRYKLIYTTLSNKYIDQEVVTFTGTHQSGHDEPSLKSQYKCILVYKEVHDEFDRIRAVYGLLEYSSESEAGFTPSAIPLDLSYIHQLGCTRVIFGEIFSNGHREVKGVHFDNYSVYIICDDFIYEIQLEEVAGSDDHPKLKVPHPTDDNIYLYNYAGLCEPGSLFKITHGHSHLMVDCIPVNFESTHHNLIIYEKFVRKNSTVRPSSDNSDQQTNRTDKGIPFSNPLIILPQIAGYSEKSLNHQFLQGRGPPALVKTTPRGLVDLYSIIRTAQIHFTLHNPKDLNPHRVHLMADNEYETASITVMFNDIYQWSSFAKFFLEIYFVLKDNLGVVVFIFTWIVLLSLLLNLDHFLRLWKARKCCKKKKKAPKMPRLLNPILTAQSDEDFMKDETLNKGEYVGSRKRRQTILLNRYKPRQSIMKDLTSQLIEEVYA